MKKQMLLMAIFFASLNTAQTWANPNKNKKLSKTESKNSKLTRLMNRSFFVPGILFGAGVTFGAYKALYQGIKKKEFKKYKKERPIGDKLLILIGGPVITALSIYGFLNPPKRIQF